MFPVYGVKDVAGLHPGPEALAGAEALAGTEALDARALLWKEDDVEAEALAGTECGRDARAPRQIRWGSRSRAAKLWPRPSPHFSPGR